MTPPSPTHGCSGGADGLRDRDHRGLGALDGGPDDAPAVPEGAILVADDLLPSLLMARDTRPAGIALARGGATSHVAIIAAGMGVPMAIGLGPALGLVEDGIDLILADGTLMIAPSQDVMADRKSTRLNSSH